jgi:hypothetical protein
MFTLIFTAMFVLMFTNMFTNVYMQVLHLFSVDQVEQIHFKNYDFEIILYTFLGNIIQLSYTYPNDFFKDFTKKNSFSLKNIKTDRVHI